jgi:hypothetical protein
MTHVLPPRVGESVRVPAAEPVSPFVT